jgi:hypothetical protein
MTLNGVFKVRKDTENGAFLAFFASYFWNFEMRDVS